MPHNVQDHRPRVRNQVVSAFWTSTTFVGENDALVNFFAQETGAACAKARGLKKATSKLAPHLQIADELLVSFTWGRSAHPILTGIKLQKGHPHWRGSLDCSALAWFMGECATLVSAEAEDNSKVYQLVVNLFRSNPAPMQLAGCASVFCLKFLALQGLLASLGHCAVSGEPLEASEPVHFLLGGEGIIGRDGYNKRYSGKSGSVVRISPVRLARWRTLLNGKLLEFGQSSADKNDVALLIHLASSVLEDATGRQVGSAKFLTTQWRLPDLRDLGEQEIV